MHAGRDHRANVLNSRELIDGRRAELVERRKPSAEQGGHPRADVADAERVEHADEPAAAAGGDLRDEGLRGFFTHPFERLELGGRQCVEISVVLHEARGDELLDELVTKPLDVHRAARCEEFQPLAAACWAVDVGAADEHALRITFQRRAAFRALGGWRPRLKLVLPQMFFDADHVRDHLARLLDHEHVPHANVLPRHFICVVQARPADDRAGKLHRLQVGHWRHRATAADLHADARQLRRGLELLELPGDRPARALRRRAELPLLVEAVHLHHEAVHLEVERVQFLDQRCAVFDECIKRSKRASQRCDGQAGLLRPCEQFRLRRRAKAGRIAHAVAEKPQRPA